MAVTHWECGEATQTTACVVVRCDSTESVTVVAAGQAKTANCNTSVKDGNARVDFTGLSAGQTYPYTINGTAAGTVTWIIWHAMVFDARGRRNCCRARCVSSSRASITVRRRHARVGR